ncbi:MAG TPA: hypothetical protein VHG08_01980, partial [Longimicrobium sp.]|nr:hypothetical protein [Longimicrobium sp.]
RRLTRCGIASTLLVAAVLLSAFVGRRAPAAVRPELFGAGLFSTGAWDFFVAWAPDGRSALFCRADDEFSTFQIFETRRERGGRWSAPRVPAFAREWSNADPHITRDGRTVYFISNRPLPGDTATTPRPSYDIWYAERGPGGEWGEARHLDAPANTPATEWSPSLSAGGNLYFGAARRGGKGQNDLWVSRLVDGVYQPPENLGDSINTAGSEIEPWIAPDESYLIFSGAARADSVGGYDLYVSERRNGVWQRARLLPRGVNTPALEFNQSVSPDGRWLYFSSTRRDPGPLGPRFDWPRHPANVAGIGSGTGDVYRIPISVLGLSRRR